MGECSTMWSAEREEILPQTFAGKGNQEKEDTGAI